MSPEFIEYYDYLLLIPYVIIFFLLARSYAKKNAETPNEFYWLLINWWLKMLAGILYTWMIVYYYGYGDPLGYKVRSDELLESIAKDWRNIKYIFLPVESFRNYISSLGYSSVSYVTIEFAYYTSNNFLISRISCITSFFTFNRFLIISFVFSNISYYGFLLIYTYSKKIIQGYNKQLAIACLFIPSCIFWSSGLSKEPICMICLGVIFSGAIQLFFLKKIRLITIIQVIVFSSILITVKGYIFFSFLFALVLWILYNGIKKIIAKSSLSKMAVFSVFITLIAAITYFARQISSNIINNVGAIITSSLDMYEVMASRQRGSFIEVSAIDVSSVGGILKFVPQGMLNVFFRPFPWEILNVLMVFTVLENLFFTLLFLKVLIKSRFLTKHLFISKNYHVFAIFFSLSLACSIGLSTFNFGSMVRYKMPFWPFWATFLFIINSKLADKKPGTL